MFGASFLENRQLETVLYLNQSTYNTLSIKPVTKVLRDQFGNNHLQNQNHLCIYPYNETIKTRLENRLVLNCSKNCSLSGNIWWNLRKPFSQKQFSNMKVFEKFAVCNTLRNFFLDRNKLTGCFIHFPEITRKYSLKKNRTKTNSKLRRLKSGRRQPFCLARIYSFSACKIDSPRKTFCPRTI